MQEIKAIRILLPLLKLYPRSILGTIVLGLVASLAEGLGISLFIPLLQSLETTTNETLVNSSWLGWIEQLFINFSSEQRIWAIAVCIIIAVLLKSSLSYAYTFFSHWLQHNIVYQLRRRAFQQIVSVSQSYWETTKCGLLVSTIDKETMHVGRALNILILLLIDIGTIAVFTFFMLLISLQLTLLAAITLLLVSIIIRVLTRKVKALGKQRLKANKDLQSFMVETITGIKTIQAFSREADEQRRFESSARRVFAFFVKLHRLSTVVNPLSEVLTVLIILGIMLVAIYQQVSLSVILTFMLLLSRLQPKVTKLEHGRTQLMSWLSSVEDVFSFLDCADKPYIRSGKIPFSGLERAITFDRVTFHYQFQKRLALENISISIAKGKTTAIVGPSGAGKSTLINLIFRFYEVDKGAIYVDNCPLPSLVLPSWRSRLAMVSQEVHIFSTTVRENIAYGRPEARDEDIIAAAKEAHAHDFIVNLPQGYDTEVGDRGIRLSGGQRQRISIARAILSDPEILILDEATNALDSLSEQYIQRAIAKLSQNRTVIVIAHRLSTIEQTDWIIVLSSGQVVQQGKFDDLRDSRGLFAQLYQIQYS